MSPAGETGTLSTPPRANASAPGAGKIESTPNSRGASVISENIGVLGVKKVGPWIQRDIEQVKECKADAMLQALLQRASSAPKTKQPELLQKCLKAVLPVCNGQTSTALVKSSDIQTALNEYVCPGVENHFYSPFIRATNIALACLEEIEVDGMRAPVPAVDMICQQNDMPMHQMHQTKKSIRKPDVVILPLNSACAPFQDEKGSKKGKQTGKQKSKQKDRQKNDEKDDEKNNEKDDGKHNENDDGQRQTRRKAHMDMNATAKPQNLPWKDVLACIEFKRKTKGIKAPPSSYTLTDYAPTKPEYLPVDHLRTANPAPAAPQTPATQTAIDTASQSSGLTAAQPSRGGSSSKRKATDTLESAAKKSKGNHDDKDADADAAVDADADADLDVTVQTGLYAAEMFAANLAANYLLNIIVVDDVAWIWYYDRQGIIQCSGINFIQDLPRFMVLLYALQRFDLHDWGRNKDFLPIEVEGKLCHEFRINDEKLGEVDLLLHTSHDERVTHYGLQGRATNVVPVTSEALTKKYGKFEDGMVAKIFWGEASRTSEPEILKKVEEIAKRHATVQGHVPELLWHHTFTNPTSAIREALDVPEPTTGSRVLYILVFRKLFPITQLHGKELFDVWRQCILCHVTLWKEGVYHRDVSPGNLMWYWRGDKRIGVLNDYDLSSLADDPGPRGNERTGTVPFMALDLLTKEGQRGEVKHLYRHDLESFMWCFAWISLRYKNGAPLPRRLRPLDEWATLDAVACGEKKYVFQGHMTASAPSGSGIDGVTWDFLVDSFLVLKKDADERYYLRLKRSSSSGEGQQPNAHDPEPDAFLSRFTSLEGWTKLSKLE
ncbi:uncharacterized protein F5891DRAFT_984273 [Suillus fuscotomentosus]|uniref:Fungal-type protein kinase domain-containing protein n=1 Tax=Suillus fuscotomentosus TaxID=1912939 RepID=A0AAD4DWC8_9AGAM|nr:uncharacterized protein F5891DRAFT_984273 [Suillus fuscotomentosus]KAG1895329.1 hypothetical protein F5891DRAFT_984273 [Suillus fuscotomentosus]